MPFALLLCLVLLGWMPAANAADQPPTPAATGKTVRVLTLGNSFTRNATAFLSQLAEANGDQVILGTCWISASNLRMHARMTRPGKKGTYGSYPKGRGTKETWTLAEALAAEPWDVITIQQFSEGLRPPLAEPPSDTKE